MTQTPAPSLATNVAVALNAVLAAVDGEQPKVLCVRTGDGGLALPYGPFDPERHRTFEIGMREWVERQTNLSLGYIEQLYTFGDKGREAPAAAFTEGDEARIVSVGYLALAPAPAEASAADAVWRDWYGFFPWEDWRGGEPAILRERIIPALARWARLEPAQEPGKDARNIRRARANVAFGLDGAAWEEERTLDRFELLYEAGLVVEAWRDRAAAGLEAPAGSKPRDSETGAAMISDHRRILATAIGRLRGKLKYRPVIFEMMRREFTLLQLQKTVEAIVGFEFHKQNFRRNVAKSGFIEPSGRTSQEGGGRPAALFVVDRDGLKTHAATGLSLPRLRATGG